MQEKINFKDNIAYYFSIAQKYKISFILIITILFIVSIIEVGHNYIFKLLIDYGAEFSSGIIESNTFVNLVLFIGLVYFISLIVLSILKYFRLYFLNLLEVKMMFDVKKDIFDHLLRLSHNFHTTNRTGSVISKLIRSSKGIEALTDFITFHGTPLLLKVIISFVVIAFIDFVSAIIVMIVVVVYVFYSFITLGKQQRINLERNDADDAEKGFISDVFLNIETVKHFGKEERISKMFSGFARTTQEKYLSFWNYYSRLESVIVLILGIGTIALMYFSIIRFMSGELTIGSITFIYTSFVALVLPLFEFMWGVRRTYEAMSDIQAVVKFKNIQNDVPDKKGAKNFVVKDGNIEFKNVSFSYNSKKLIQNFNLKIKSNEKIAFVGHSGAGKTTIIKLLYRLYNLNSGEILIDGENISNLKQESLRNELSIVPQECVLFNDTIYNNVLFSNTLASKKEVFNALKIAQLYDFVMSLPDKENTVVGERGIKLSGGEKQRLSIARAILANKKILVLDEATSALDSTTEHNIQESLWKLMKGKTTLMIAHRLSTIMHADKIIVIEKGKIVEIGNHKELAEKKGVYQKLWKLQRSGELKK